MNARKLVALATVLALTSIGGAYAQNTQAPAGGPSATAPAEQAAQPAKKKHAKKKRHSKKAAASTKQ